MDFTEILQKIDKLIVSVDRLARRPEVEVEIEIDKDKAVISVLTIPILEQLFWDVPLDHINDLFYDICYYSHKNKLDLTMLKYCVNSGSNLNYSKSKFGSSLTPFECLVLSSNINNFDADMFKYCLSKGAIIRKPMLNNWSAFYWICFYIENSKYTKYNKKTNAKDVKHESILMLKHLYHKEYKLLSSEAYAHAQKLLKTYDIST